MYIDVYIYTHIIGIYERLVRCGEIGTRAISSSNDNDFKTINKRNIKNDNANSTNVINDDDNNNNNNNDSNKPNDGNNDPLARCLAIDRSRTLYAQR